MVQKFVKDQKKNKMQEEEPNDAFALLLVNRILPPSFPHKICKFTLLDSAETQDPSLSSTDELPKFSTELRVKMDTEAECEHWLSEFENLTKTKWITVKTFPQLAGKGKGRARLTYRKNYKCQHSAANKSTSEHARKSTRNLHCEATLEIRLDAFSKKKSKRIPDLKEGFLGLIKLIFNHSHSVGTGDSLSLLPFNPQTREQFFRYFEEGLNITSAMERHKQELLIQSQGDMVHFEKLCKDTSELPKRRTLEYWYYSLWRKGSTDIDTLIGNLNSKRDKLCTEGYLMDFETLDDEEVEDRRSIVVALVTPLMRRAHRNLVAATDVVFLDSITTTNTPILTSTFLFASSCAGGIPLGVVLVTSQTHLSYSRGFAMLINLIGKDSPFEDDFYPSTFVIDDSVNERTALKNVWPESVHRLPFSLAPQMAWEWLNDPNNNIYEPDRVLLMEDFQWILKCSSEEKVEELYLKMYESETAQKYSNWQLLLEEYWSRKEEWCAAWRQQVTETGIPTNNNIESTIRLCKEGVLTCRKITSITAMLDFCTQQLERIYENKILKLSKQDISNKIELETSKCSYLQKNDLFYLNNGCFIVPRDNSEETPCLVQTGSGDCTCPNGYRGEFCEHCAAVCKFYPIFMTRFPNYPRFTTTLRSSLGYYEKEAVIEVSIAPRTEGIMVQKTKELPSESSNDVEMTSKEELKGEIVHLMQTRLELYSDDTSVQNLITLRDRLHKIDNATDLETFISSSPVTPLKQDSESRNKAITVHFPVLNPVRTRRLQFLDQDNCPSFLSKRQRME